MTNLVTRFTFVSLITATLLAGCGKNSEPAGQTKASSENTADTHEPVEIPMTDQEIEALKQGVTSYVDALAKIKSYRDTIRDVLAAGDPHSAHRPLDELNIVLELLPTVARDNNIPKSQWETVNTSAQEISDLFNQVHAQIDGGEKGDFAAVDAEIESALARLEAAQLAG